MDDLREETIRRNEAETLVKVLKDIIEARKQKQENKSEKCEQMEQISDEVEDHRVNHRDKQKVGSLCEESIQMEVDEVVEDVNGLWEVQRKQKQYNRKRNRSLKEVKLFNCQKCIRKFQAKVDLENHQVDHIEIDYTACGKTSNTEEMIGGTQRNT